MKRINVLLFFFSMFFFSACFDKVDPEVETMYLESGTDTELKEAAFTKLNDLYTASDKSKNYYEVIGRKNTTYILNYYPAGGLITCANSTSGWAGQFKNVDEIQLKRLADLKMNLDTIAPFIYKDSILVTTEKPMIEVKSNWY